MQRKPCGESKNGTTIKVWWPDSASSIIEESKGRFLQIAEDYTFLNPHLSLTVDWLGEVTKTRPPPRPGRNGAEQPHVPALVCC